MSEREQIQTNCPDCVNNENPEEMDFNTSCPAVVMRAIRVPVTETGHPPAFE